MNSKRLFRRLFQAIETAARACASINVAGAQSQLTNQISENGHYDIQIYIYIYTQGPKVILGYLHGRAAPGRAGIKKNTNK